MEEGFGGTQPDLAIAKMLQDAQALDYSLKLDRAHRSLQPKLRDGDPPKLIVVKLHMDILWKAVAAGAIFHNNRRFHVYPDYTTSAQAKRAAFSEVSTHFPSAFPYITVLGLRYDWSDQ